KQLPFHTIPKERIEPFWTTYYSMHDPGTYKFSFSHRFVALSKHGMKFSKFFSKYDFIYRHFRNPYRSLLQFLAVGISLLLTKPINDKRNNAKLKVNGLNGSKRE